MNEALTTSNLPTDFVSGTIVLAKKKGDDHTIKGYRPISLLNFDYKILSRIVKHRLEHVLVTNEVLSATQKCANPERSIFEATLALKDRISQLLTAKRKGKLISFDLDHAFDRVSHEFLYRTMLEMGFRPELVALIQRINSAATSRLLINGHLSPAFPIERSVRQGDPISMMLFVLHFHPFLTRLESICSKDLCVAYADDISVIVSSTEQIEQIRVLFMRFERVAGAKLNFGKTYAIDVGWCVGNWLMVPWLQSRQQVKILGIIFTNSLKEMIKLNWDKLVTQFTQQVWLYSRRTLTLLQKVMLLNTFISSRIWYVASVIPPQNQHTAKITATMGNLLWRNMPARIPMIQLARTRREGGLNLQLPAFKCKALALCRYSKEMIHLPITQQLITQDSPPPSMFPCLKFIQKHYATLPAHLRANPTSKALNSYFVNQTERPKVERSHTNTDWKRIWYNIGSKQLPSDIRTELYLFVNRKTKHNRLLHTLQRVTTTSCIYCSTTIETLEHKFADCQRVTHAWEYTQDKIKTISGSWSRPSFGSLIRPELKHIQTNQRNHILRLLATYISFINECNDSVDMNELAFNLDVC